VSVSDVSVDMIYYVSPSFNQNQYRQTTQMRAVAVGKEEKTVFFNGGASPPPTINA